MAKLKPCPFCGGEAYTYTALNSEKGVQRKYWLVHCKKCEINDPSYSRKCFTEQEAVDAWNTRTQQKEAE